MEDLILELKKRRVEFKVLSDGSIDCEAAMSLEQIECLERYKRYAYIDDMESGRCRYHIERR